MLKVRIVYKKEFNHVIIYVFLLSIAKFGQLDDVIDLVIPRGSNKLVTLIKESTKIPVLGHAGKISKSMTLFVNYIHGSDFFLYHELFLPAKMIFEDESCVKFQFLLCRWNLPCLH